MVLDSPGLLCALTLLTAVLGAWILSAPLRARARLYLRFAAALFAAWCAAFPLGLSLVASLVLLPLAAGSLMIAARAQFAAPLPVFAASLALVLSLACGLGAFLTGMSLLTLVPSVIAALVIIATGLNRGHVIAALAGASLALAALSSWNEGAQGGMFLFSAAALLGLARPRIDRELPMGAGREARFAPQLLRSSNSALREEPRLP